MTPIDWHPSSERLRRFGLMATSVFAYAAFRAFRGVPPDGGALASARGLAGSGFLLVALASLGCSLVFPAGNRALWVFLMLVTAPVSAVASTVALAVVFFGSGDADWRASARARSRSAGASRRFLPHELLGERAALAPPRGLFQALLAMAEPNDFLSRAAAPRRGLLRQFAAFLRQERKWWLVPILITLLLLGIVVVLSGTSAAPFIYTLF